MKRLCIITTLILAMASCTVPIESEMAEVHFYLDNTTKCTGPGEEKDGDVSHWAVLLFNSLEPSEVYTASAEGRAGISFSVKRGTPYKAYAIANYPSFGDGIIEPGEIRSEDGLRSARISLADYSPSCLPMLGETYLATSSEEISRTFLLNRLISKVVLKKVTVDMADEQFRSLPFTLNSIYLTNVLCRSSLADDIVPDETPEIWYNARKWHGSGTIAAIDAMVSDRNINAVIQQGKSYSEVHRFYAMPDAVGKEQDRRDGPWSARCTRLVIEATVGGMTCYYPITIPGMKRGIAYTVDEVIIRNPGSLDPETEIPGAAEVKFSIPSPGTWDEIYNIYEDS